MSSPGGSTGSGGAVGGPGTGNQGGGAAGQLANSATVLTYTTAITTMNATPTATSSTSSTSSTPKSPPSHHGRDVIIGSAVGSAVGLLLILFLAIWLINRRIDSKAKASKPSSTQISRPLQTNGSIQPITYTGLNREFTGVPFRRSENWSDNQDGLLPQPLFANSTEPSNSGSRPSISSRRSGRSPRGGVDDEEMVIHTYGDILPPSYEESQSDELSMRVLTPQHTRPSAFLSENTAQAAGFLSPHPSPRFESPYAAAQISPTSPNTEFFAPPGRHYAYEDERMGRDRRSVVENVEEEEPNSPLEPPRALSVSRDDLRAATDSLESLVRGPGGLLGRSASGRTVESFLSSDGDSREMAMGRRSNGSGGRVSPMRRP